MAQRSTKRSCSSQRQLLASSTLRISRIISPGSKALVVFMLHVKRSERGFASRPSSRSFSTPTGGRSVSTRSLLSGSCGFLRTNLEVNLLKRLADGPRRPWLAPEGEAGGTA